MEWLKKNWLAIVCAFGLAVLAWFEDTQHLKRVSEFKEILVKEETLELTAWSKKFFKAPIKKEVLEEIQSAMKNEAIQGYLKNDLQMDVDELQRNNEMASNLSNKLDSANISMNDIVTAVAESKSEHHTNECEVIRGLYRINTCTEKYTHKFTPARGWIEMFFSIPPGKDLLEYVWWYNDDQGRAIIDRSISVIVRPGE